MEQIHSVESLILQELEEELFKPEQKSRWYEKELATMSIHKISL
jgi:hypothetical protein